MLTRPPLPSLLARLCIQVDPRAEHCRTTQVAQLYKEEKFEDLLQETVEVVERRKLLKEMLEKLEHANNLLEEVNDVGSKVVL